MSSLPDRPDRPSPAEYRELLRAHLAPVLERAARSTHLPLAACADSVLAVPLRASVDLPLFVNSQMDGYAVRSVDIAGAGPDSPARLRVVGAVHAGDGRGHGVDDDEACKVMTGAPVPEGADCVVPVEDTRVSDTDPTAVLVVAPRSPGEFIRRPGDDVRAGDVVIDAGVRLAARHLAAAASLGESGLDVRPRPRVGVVATGSELVAPGRPLGPGQIWESNSITLAAALKACGCEVTTTTISGDDRGEFTAALDAATGDADLVVTAGAVSMGDAEVVRQVLADREGARFAPIAMQPGGPQGLSTWRGTPVVCLPGNPVSALVSFVVLLRPVILEAVGRSPVQPVRARLSRDVTSPAGKVQFLRAALGPDSGAGIPVVEPVSGSGSHLVASMARADVLVEIPADVTSLAAGTEVDAVAL
ncbi:molybdopterin molybdotransferase MoeA [Dietzia cinnamea]|uniref:Molybdopterin molybdenumtransferase n=2 Tax=Dietzia TaxID=37914 RepID=A0A4R3ZU47_9ACTN|nr:gephyrin-like molybdotransferase Glp [Dietzia cinnamea]MCT1863477.1 molybdopterin molybdotransferase MoeA [Dietzia cinnamea]MCT2029157.1 molybdopterin molybdotransferase MoeA [Dietzia cinnamea]MCT2032790.1 molybdopterin molybdotransferase MoeA [Dietzia cinnamea]MCT2075330.1 molybdopterin molybdotransferase MoeA [Dietzia cinnamea]MCT2097885.1 molybdopterin molybdotransferase MoeA [Dietzia cinnamea]